MQKITSFNELVNLCYQRSYFEISIIANQSAIKSVQARIFDDPGFYKKAEKGLNLIDDVQITSEVLDDAFALCGKSHKKSFRESWWEILSKKDIRFSLPNLNALEISNKTYNSSGYCVSIKCWMIPNNKSKDPDVILEPLVKKRKYTKRS